MSTPPTPPGGPATPPAAPNADPVSPERIQEFLLEARRQQNLSAAVAAGLGAALAGAAVWAAISYAIERQIGWMAVGVGFLVGFSVRRAGRSFDKSFGYLGAGLSLFGCLLGNVLMICAFVAQHESMAYFHVLSRITPAVALQLLTATFSPIDVLFYGLALYYGYRYSFRRITDREIDKLSGHPA